MFGILPIPKPLFEILASLHILHLATQHVARHTTIYLCKRIHVNQIGILYVRTTQFIKGIDLVEHVIQDAICHIFLVGVVQIKERADTGPELAQEIHHLCKDAVCILLAIEIFLQTLVATATAEMGKHLFRNSIVGSKSGIMLLKINLIFQLRITLLNILPDIGSVFHHADNIHPFVGATLTQYIRPQVGVLMDGNFRC